jgi:hypothetical protein
MSFTEGDSGRGTGWIHRVLALTEQLSIPDRSADTN